MRICIVGDPEDLSAAYIGWLAEKRGIHVHRFDERELGVTWRIGSKDGRAWLEEDGQTIHETDVHGIFVRLNPKPGLPDSLASLDPAARAVLMTERRSGLHALLDAVSCNVVNRPSAGRANASKPFQMHRLHSLGLRVPDWTVTNDPDKASRFAASKPSGAVFKSCSGLRSRVRLVDEAMVESLIAGTAPVVVQEFVPGTEVRVHVVGNRTFGTVVNSDAIDYRWAASGGPGPAVPLPAQVARRSARVARADGLELAGLDFRIDKDGTWWCLEMNPVPSFLPYEASSGSPIGDAIIDVLAPESATGQCGSSSPLARLEGCAQPGS